MHVTSRNVMVLIWNQEGNNFSGPVKDDTRIVEAHLSPEKPLLGAVFSITHKWHVAIGSSKLEAIVQVFYQFRTKDASEKINKIHLFGLTKDSIRETTFKLNEEFLYKKLNIPPRREPAIVLDGKMDSFFDGILEKRYSMN